VLWESPPKRGRLFFFFLHHGHERAVKAALQEMSHLGLDGVGIQIILELAYSSSVQLNVILSKAELALPVSTSLL
jgi:hypothetical protein